MLSLETDCRFQRGLDPWTCAAALPGVLTLCVIAYGCLAWIGNQPGQAKPLAVGAVKQAQAPTSPASLPSVPPPTAPMSDPQEAKLPTQSDKPAERVEVSAADPFALSTVSAAQNERTPVSRADVAPHSAARDVTNIEHAREVQRRLATLGYFTGSARGSWGPLSRTALAEFKAAHRLPPNGIWDRETEAVVFSGKAHGPYPFVGVWAVEATACSTGHNDESVVTIIQRDRAQAGTASCAFRDKREVEDGWSINASCTSSDENWTANIRLSVRGNRLTWTSERGTQEYVRCGSLSQVARVR
jgi:Putative peptidoglycan binding domain